MPLTYKVKIDPKLWKSSQDFRSRYQKRFKLAMFRALSILHGQVRRNLSGPSHTRFPGNGNPFPGTLSSRLKNSVHIRPIQMAADGMIGITGPNVKYARAHEFGIGVPKRPYLAPALKLRLNDVDKVFKTAIEELAAGQ